ncbi:MAG TPA: VOC family protein [Candidatus Saccharimonadales bacterium]|nr:VOC family protein [Candidatus Saccharimonadales bacterium]
MKTTLNPYLHFNGDCEKAMNFYKSVFGGELALTKFGDMPMPGNDADPAKIMHSELKATDGFNFMASDGGKGTMNTDNFSISLNGEDAETLKKYFDALAEGGKVTVPVAKHPWGAEFGMLKDQFGIDWMVNIVSEEK